MMPRPSRKEEVLALLPPPEAAGWTKRELGQRGTVAYLMRRMNVISDTTVGRYLNMLHDEGRAHIARWITPRGWPAAVWVQGNGEHAPVPIQHADDRKRRYRKNVVKAIQAASAGRDFDERYTRHVRRAQADATVLQVRQQPQTWLSALGQ